MAVAHTPAAGMILSLYHSGYVLGDSLDQEPLLYAFINVSTGSFLELVVSFACIFKAL